MSKFLAQKIVINPTTYNNPIPVYKIMEELKIAWSCTSIHIEDRETHKNSEIILTHPIFRLKKEARLSKNKKFKPEGIYYVVFNPEPIGKGSYAGVYPILGVWKQKKGQWEYKIKTQDINKEQVVKTNLIYSDASSEHSPESVARSFNDEYSMGKWVMHMGYKTPVIRYNDVSLLISLKQQGITLKNLIKQLQDDPNSYSVTDRLRITINLLTELEHQVNGINIPTTDKSKKVNYLVHSDIKPANTMINGVSVRFIDYGLARFNGPIPSKIGTPLYMDPKIYSGAKLEVDKVSDLSSLFRTIAELWGDKSGSAISESSALLKRNHDDELIDLFKEISDLDSKEQNKIKAIIKSGISYHETKRMSRELALEEFQKILSDRLLKEKLELQDLMSTELKNIPENKLYFILKSPQAVAFLLKHKQNASVLKLALTKLELKLFNLDEQVLRTIGDGYIDFSNPDLLYNMLDNKNFTASHLQICIRLGARVSDEILQKWLDKFVGLLQEARWVSICRELFKHNPNASKLVYDIPDKTSFVYLYSTRFILPKDVSIDDSSHIRLLRKHMGISQYNETKVDFIKRLLTNQFPNTAFTKALINELETYLARNQWQLVVEEDLDKIHIQLVHLISALKALDLLSTLPGMQARGQAIEFLKQMLNTRLNLEGPGAWEYTMDFIPQFVKRFQVIAGLDSLVESTLAHSPKDVVELIRSQLDQHYGSPETGLEQLQKNYSEFLDTIDLIKGINKIRREMSQIGTAFQEDVLLEQDFKTIVNNINIAQPQNYQLRLTYLLKIYSSCYKLFNGIQTSKDSPSDLCAWTYNVYTKIENKLTFCFLEDQAQLFMEQLLSKTVAELVKKRLEIDKKLELKKEDANPNLKFFSAEKKKQSSGQGISATYSRRETAIYPE